MEFLAVGNFDFTRKIVKKILGEKLVKMLEFCQNLIFGQKFDFSNSVYRWMIISCFISSPSSPALLQQISNKLLVDVPEEEEGWA